MTRLVLLATVTCLGLTASAPALADADTPPAQAPAKVDAAPRLSAGGGAGYPFGLHGDASLFLVRYVSVDARLWTQALLPTKGADATASLHVPLGSWGPIATGGVGIWREDPERFGRPTDERESSLYWRAAAGAGYMGNALDLRIMAGVTSRPDGHSVTIDVTVMRRMPKR